MRQFPKISFEWSAPNMITLLNLFCGFLSLLMASHHHFMSAGWLLALALVFDSLDGNIAYLFHDTSEFGKELDSLSDMVSFVAAPAFFVWSFLDVISKTVIVPFLFFFIACGAFRLARFNLSSVRKSYFQGLPTPCAALVTVMFGLASLKNGWAGGEIYQFLFCGFVALLGLLMISHVKYPKFSAIPFRKWWHVSLGAVAFLGGVSYLTNTETAFFALLMSFIFVSPFYASAFEPKAQVLSGEEVL